MKIHPIAHPQDRHSQRHYRNFMYAAGLDSGQNHQLVEKAEEAEALLFFEPGDDPTAAWLRNHKHVQRFPEKCFSYSENDHPFCYLPGIHVSARRPVVFPGRVRSFAYISYGPSEPLRNPYVESLATEWLPQRYLFSFIGRITHKSRKTLLEHDFGRDDVLIKVPEYNHWGPRTPQAEALQRRYAEVAKSSSFAICPRGDGLNSIRLYEMMQLGVVPVIISDGWYPPEGPDWDECAIRIPEKAIPDLVDILMPLRHKAVKMGRNARKEWEIWFSPERIFQNMGDLLGDIRRRRKIPERVARSIWMLALLRHGFRYGKSSLSVWLKRTGLRHFP